MKPFVRRVLLVAALLGVGSLVAIYSGKYHYRWGHPRTSSLGGYQHAIVSNTAAMVTPLGPRFYDDCLNSFCWGIDSLAVVLAIWLVCRAGVWQTYTGRCRGLLYAAAFVYGGLLTHALHRWIHELKRNGYPPDGFGFSKPLQWPPVIDRLPGTAWNDYGRTWIDCVAILSMIWVLYPLAKSLALSLGHRSHEARVQNQFSIGAMLLWTLVAAAILGQVQLLTHWIAPANYLHLYRPTEAMAEFGMLRLPSCVIRVLLMTAIAFTCYRLRWSVPVLLLAILVDGFAHQAMYAIAGEAELFRLPRRDIYLGEAHEWWAYVAGRNVVGYVAFVTAALLGVRLRRNTAAKTQKELDVAPSSHSNQAD